MERIRDTVVWNEATADVAWWRYASIFRVLHVMVEQPGRRHLGTYVQWPSMVVMVVGRDGR